MLLGTERRLIAEHGRRMTSDRLVVGTSGNLSIRTGDLVAVTPTGHAYQTLTPELVCVHRLDGSAVEAELAPTSELPIHQLIYRLTDARAVVHTHSTAATVVSTLVDELPTIHYILAVMGGPIRVAPYARFGSPELADGSVAAMADRTGVLLRNHGATTYGDTLAKAYTRSIYLEWVCKLYHQAKLIGEPTLLSAEQLDEVAKVIDTYGQAVQRAD